MVLKELILNSFYWDSGRVVKELILTVDTLRQCGVSK